jgi:hypothetical protein
MDMGALRRQFDEFDKDGSGRITLAGATFSMLSVCMLCFVRFSLAQRFEGGIVGHSPPT